jgi:hypothetical protein
MFETTRWQGEAYNAEPHKHSQAEWFNINNLPKNTIPALAAVLQDYLAGKTYAEYGWD